jgi:pSer/pThr/pTyr-binding forkhead associated (FHA) protein
VLQDNPGVGFSQPAPEPTAGSVLQQQAASGAPARRLIAVLAAPDLGSGGTVFAVRGGRNTIGSDRSSDIVLASDSEVSREHAVILHRNGMFHLADRLSTNGTWVNGEEVPANGTVPLNDRDRIRCGRTEMVFLVVELAESASAGLGYE